MPCRDYYDDHPEAYFGEKLKDKDAEITKLKKQVSFAESALCAALNALDNRCREWEDPIDMIDCIEAGISRDALRSWRTKHQELDARHRAEEAERKAEAKREAEMKKKTLKLKSEALAKLNPDERKALGLKE